MSTHDGGVDHHVFVVVIAGQQLENTVAPLRCCPGLTSTLMSSRSMAIISVPLRSIAPLNWRRRRCTSTPACHKLAPLTLGNVGTSPNTGKPGGQTPVCCWGAMLRTD